MKSEKLICPITGSSYILSDSNIAAKIKEYGDTENINKYFISKKAKKYIIQGYGVLEIRKILEVEADDLPSEEDLESLVLFHKSKFGNIMKKRKSLVNLSAKDSDPLVVEFINNIR